MKSSLLDRFKRSPDKYPRVFAALFLMNLALGLLVFLTILGNFIEK